jgi:hypothetical protein
MALNRAACMTKSSACDLLRVELNCYTLGNAVTHFSTSGCLIGMRCE